MRVVYEEDLPPLRTGGDGEWDEPNLDVRSEPTEYEDHPTLKKPRDRMGKISPGLRYKLMLKFGWRCATCHTERELQIDHIQPVSRGGSDDEENLQVLCRACNLYKGSKWRPKR